MITDLYLIKVGEVVKVSPLHRRSEQLLTVSKVTRMFIETEDLRRFSTKTGIETVSQVCRPWEGNSILERIDFQADPYGKAIDSWESLFKRTFGNITVY